MAQTLADAGADILGLSGMMDGQVGAVRAALDGVSGLVGQDEDRGGVIRACEVERVAGAKPFDVTQPWFTEVLAAIGQPVGRPASH